MDNNVFSFKELTKKEKSPLGQAIFDLFLWQYSPEATHFTIHLYSLIDKADVPNRLKLRLSFPHEVEAYEQWEAAPNEKKFFQNWGLVK